MECWGGESYGGRLLLTLSTSTLGSEEGVRAPEPQPRGKALPWLYACQQHTFTQDVTYPWLGHFSGPLPIAHSLAVRAASENRPEAVSLEHSYELCEPLPALGQHAPPDLEWF